MQVYSSSGERRLAADNNRNTYWETMGVNDETPWLMLMWPYDITVSSISLAAPAGVVLGGNGRNAKVECIRSDGVIMSSNVVSWESGSQPSFTLTSFNPVEAIAAPSTPNRLITSVSIKRDGDVPQYLAEVRVITTSGDNIARAGNPMDGVNSVSAVVTDSDPTSSSRSVGNANPEFKFNYPAPRPISRVEVVGGEDPRYVHYLIGSKIIFGLEGVGTRERIICGFDYSIDGTPLIRVDLYPTPTPVPTPVPTIGVVARAIRVSKIYYKAGDNYFMNVSFGCAHGFLAVAWARFFFFFFFFFFFNEMEYRYLIKPPHIIFGSPS